MPRGYSLGAVSDAIYPTNRPLASGVSLNTLYGRDNEGIWYQDTSSSATSTLGYPTTEAGVLEVLVSNAGSKGTCIQRYTTYSTCILFTRTCTGFSSGIPIWTDWVSTVFSSNDTPNSGWIFGPNGHIHQYGVVSLGEVGKYNPQVIGGATYYTRYYVIKLPRPYVSTHQVTNITIAGRDFDNQGGVYGLWAMCNRNVDASGPSLTSFTVSVTSIDPTQKPIIHFTSEGY